MLARRRVYTTIQQTHLCRTHFLLSSVVKILLRKMACKIANEYWNKCTSPVFYVKRRKIKNEYYWDMYFISNLEKVIILYGLYSLYNEEHINEKHLNINIGNSFHFKAFITFLSWHNKDKKIFCEKVPLAYYSVLETNASLENISSVSIINIYTFQYLY